MNEMTLNKQKQVNKQKVKRYLHKKQNKLK